MGYERTFMPTREAVDELRKCVSRSVETRNSIKTELTAYCMLDHSQETIAEVMTKIRYYLYSLKYKVRSECYEIAVDQYEEHNEIWFCGWEYSHSSPDSEVDEVLDYTLDKLLMMSCVVKTPDWFSDSEKFYEKINEINSAIDYFSDEMTTIVDYEIMEKLKEYERITDYSDLLKQKEDTGSFKVSANTIATTVTDPCLKTDDVDVTKWTVTLAKNNEEFLQETNGEE